MPRNTDPYNRNRGCCKGKDGQNAQVRIINASKYSFNNAL